LEFAKWLLDRFGFPAGMACFLMWQQYTVLVPLLVETRNLAVELRHLAEQIAACPNTAKKG
jgi:hypothetical protein